MENVIEKICPPSELRYVLMSVGFEPYILTKIELRPSTNDYILTLKLDGYKEKGIQF